MKKILIIGGMGPQASLRLHRLILDKAVKNGAKDGKDFPSIVHLSLPIDDFISDQSKTIDALATIRESLYCLWQHKVYRRGYSMQHCAHICG